MIESVAHAALLDHGFTWNEDPSAPVYHRRCSGVLVQVAYQASVPGTPWLLSAHKYVDTEHRDASVPGLAMAYPDLGAITAALRAGDDFEPVLLVREAP